MTDVLFYHLERAALESVLPELLEKTLARGWRALVRVGAPEKVATLDETLWTYRDESFLPHGAAGDGAAQPIWLTTGEDALIEAPNDAHVLFLTAGADAPIDKLSKFERCVMIFDGRDDEALNQARTFWKDVNGAGYKAAYWKQTAEGGWAQQQ